jgi:hypothetical protein
MGVLFPRGFRGVCFFDLGWSIFTIPFISPVLWRRAKLVFSSQLPLCPGFELLVLHFRVAIVPNTFSVQNDGRSRSRGLVLNGLADRRIDQEIFVFR